MKILVTLVIVLVAFICLLIGTAAENARNAPVLTPEQRHAQTLKSCAEMEELFRFKFYSEMSEYDRRMLYYCELQLAYPREQIFRQSE
jgi:hypothetical protein